MIPGTNKILYLIQLPPPVHGVSTINSIVYGSHVINAGLQKLLLELNFNTELKSLRKFNATKAFKFISLVRRLHKIIRTEKPDFVYFSVMLVGKGFWRDLILVRILKKSGARIIYHIHNRGIAGESRNPVRRQLLKYTLSNSIVIHLSEKLISFEIQELKLTNATLVVVPNGIPEGKPVIPHEASLNRGSGISLLFLSNLFPQKGIYDLLDIMSMIKEQRTDIQLRIAGEFLRKKYRRKLVRGIQSMGLADKVTIVSPKNREEIEAEYLQSDIFIFPTYFRQECFPLVLLEAMMHNLPIISSNIGAIPEMIENEKQGLLIDERNLPGFANAIMKLADDPVLRKSIGRAARAKYLEQYTETQLARNIRKVFEEQLFEQK